jgi:putative nucleotidyltransferase with HDIG domain
MKQAKTASRLFGKLLGGGRGPSGDRPAALPTFSALIVLVSFGAVLTVVLLATQFGSFFPIVRPGDQEIGSVAARDIVVSRDILYTDERATQLKREAAEELVLPVYRVNDTLGRENLDRFERFRELVLEFRGTSVPNATAFLRLQVEFPGLLQRGELDALLDNPRLETLLEQARELLGQIFETGLIGVLPLDSALNSAASSAGEAPRFVQVWRWREGRLEKVEYAAAEVLTFGRLPEWLQLRLEDLPAQNRALLRGLVEAFATENCFYDSEETNRGRRRAAESVEPVQAKLVEGQVIIRKGDIVNPETAAKLKALGEFSTTVNLRTLAGSILFVAVVFALGAFTLREHSLGAALNRGQLLFLGVSAVGYLLLAGVLVQFFKPGQGGVPFSVILPTAAVSILVSLIVSARVGFVFSLMISLLLLPVTGMNVYAFLFAALTGLAGTAVVQKAERRIDLVRAGVYLSLLNMPILGFCALLGGVGGAWLLRAVGWSLVNGFVSSMIGMAFLPLLEHALNTASRFRLIELSDLNAPVLRRMLSLAPGTYSHSISVANLAESACSAIGGNSLLARVGSYYHDIGKIEQAEYFIENQTSYNKHDELKPSLSAAVIKSHLKMGIEKARELDLPAEVQDIISQHHGRGIIRYFYQRALENDERTSVGSEEYAYPGARPQSREAAVVMLADTVEAASRTLKKPNIAKLEKFVWDAIMEKFSSQDLGESDLTLRDLETIKKSFVQVLAGYYHSRIEYPKAKEAAR